MKLPKYPNVNGIFPVSKRLLESQSWNELSDKEKQIFMYYYMSLRWVKAKKNDIRYIPTNNGKISVPLSHIRKQLNIGSKATTTKAIYNLVRVGFIEITEMASKKTTYKIKVLIQPACNRGEENWKQYPEKNWEHKAPKRAKAFPNGQDTWKENFKNKPSEVVSKSSNKPSSVDLNNGTSLFGQVKNNTKGAI